MTRGIRQVMVNSGQNCNTPSRMLVPTDRMNRAIEIARKAATNVTPGAPDDGEADIGPVVSLSQYERI